MKKRFRVPPLSCRKTTDHVGGAREAELFEAARGDRRADDILHHDAHRTLQTLEVVIAIPM
jgi:hypothetical protein